MRARLRRWRAAFAVFAFAFVAPAALAHTKSETHSVWEVAGDQVHLEFSIPLVESARLAHAGEDQPSNAGVLAYLHGHLGATSKGKACAITHAHAMAATTQFRRFELEFTCPGKDDIARGSWIVAPPMAECSERIDVELTLTADCGVTLKSWSPLHVHLGAAHHTAHAVLLGAGDGAQELTVMTPGQTTRVQLVLDAPVQAVPGDRFVIRNAQATATVGVLSQL